MLLNWEPTKYQHKVFARNAKLCACNNCEARLHGSPAHSTDTMEKTIHAHPTAHKRNMPLCIGTPPCGLHVYTVKKAMPGTDGVCTAGTVLFFFPRKRVVFALKVPMLSFSSKIRLAKRMHKSSREKLATTIQYLVQLYKKITFP